MSDAPIAVLLVEDDPSDAAVIQKSLAETGERSFRVEWVTNLSAALERLSRADIEVVVLDLGLPDGRGLSVFDQVFQAAPNAPIVVLSAASDEQTARRAVQRSAHDHVVKGHVNVDWWPRALCYLIERKVTRDELQCSEARFRAISDASPLGIFVCDAMGGCVYTNAAYQKISGLSGEETRKRHAPGEEMSMYGTACQCSSPKPIR